MKAQITIEFVSYSVIFLLAMGTMLAIVVLLGNDQVQLQKENTLKAFAKQIAVSLNFAISMGDNFEYSVKVGETLNGQSYKVYFVSSSLPPGKSAVVVELDDGSVYPVIIPSTVFSAGGNAYTYSKGVYIDSTDIKLNSLNGRIKFIVSSGNNVEVSLE